MASQVYGIGNFTTQPKKWILDFIFPPPQLHPPFRRFQIIRVAGHVDITVHLVCCSTVGTLPMEAVPSTPSEFHSCCHALRRESKHQHRQSFMQCTIIVVVMHSEGSPSHQHHQRFMP
eukprot:4787823-Amphidinium_carterae.3